VAHASGVMASAAYWLASQATMIVSEPSAQSGSIGIYHAFLDESRHFAAEGLNVELFKSGKFKGAGIRGLPLNDEQRAYIQARVDKIFGWFKADLAVNRDIPESAMDGRVFFSDEAVVLDLIDAIGDEAAALAELTALMA
jgi:ClpP class serine protease